MTISCLIFLTGCDVVPPLEHATGGIPVRDIVMRVKCELAEAFDQKVQDPHFRWMADWTAKVDLTLQADASGGFNPGGSYISPIQTESISWGKVTRNFTQDFTLGAGLNLSEKATRTEMISFSLSLKELKAWRKTQRPLCVPDGRELAGELGFKEWVDTALEPVAMGDLKAGDHPSPASAKSGGKGSSSTGKARSNAVLSFKAQAAEAVSQAKKDSNDAQKAADNAESSASKADSAVRNAEAAYSSVLESGYRRQSSNYVNAARNQAREANRLADLASEKTREAQSAANTIADNDYSDAARTALDKVLKLADEARVAAVNAKNQADAAEKNNLLAQQRTPDAPIDSISHSVQFVVSYGASVSPSWNLMHFKGPGGNLAAVNGVRTHTLNIALGPRGDTTVSQEAVRALNTLTIQQSRPVQ
jgi:hypothetical protein